MPDTAIDYAGLGLSPAPANPPPAFDYSSLGLTPAQQQPVEVPHEAIGRAAVAGFGPEPILPTEQDIAKLDQTIGPTWRKVAVGVGVPLNLVGRSFNALMAGGAEALKQALRTPLGDDAADQAAQALTDPGLMATFHMPGMRPEVPEPFRATPPLNPAQVQAVRATPAGKTLDLMAPPEGAPAAPVASALKAAGVEDTAKQAIDHGLVYPHVLDLDGAMRRGTAQVTMPDLVKAKSLGVLDGDQAYFGTGEPTPESAQAISAAGKADALAEAGRALQAAPEAPGPDIHAIAREIAPDTFEQFDRLKAQHDQFTGWINELADMRDRGTSPAIEDLDRQIDDVRARRLEAEGADKRAMANQINELEGERAKLADALPKEGDTPEMAEVRQARLQNEFPMRDLAPQVSAAYRQAEERAQGVTSTTGQPVETLQKPPEVVTPVAAPTAPAEAPAAASPAINIAQDAARQLQGAGRPSNEAKAAGALVEAYYNARAARLTGTTAESLYREQGAQIRAGRGAKAAERERELAQPAYHGSPFKFDKFTTDHIGKGEGAQAYGWGLYFAGKKAVAKYYRDALTATTRDDAAAVNGLLPHEHQGSLDNARRIIENVRRAVSSGEIKKAADYLDEYDVPKNLEPAYQEAMQRVGSGRLYHVEIAPKNEELLDWDKPLSEQSPKVREAMEKLDVPMRDKWKESGAWEHVKGKTLYDELVSGIPGRTLFGEQKPYDGPRRASEVLRDAGVRGIRYLDQASRRPGFSTLTPAQLDARIDALKADIANGTGDAERMKDQLAGLERERESYRNLTHNFVIFDGADVAIREFEQTRRGKITLGPDRNTITLLKNADASTFIHESGHDWLEQLMRDAQDERAKPEVREDAAKVHDWLGTKEGEAIPTRAHEKFARGFEAYMREGRAPSQKLADVFRQFRDWLIKIYQTATQLKAPISDDIRGVFDRMLTTPEERTVIAPEREPGKGFADIHEADAERATHETGTAVGDTIESEVDEVARAHPEVVPHEKLNPEGPAGGAGEQPPPGPGAPGGGAAAGPEAGRPGAPAEPGALPAGGGEGQAQSRGAPAITGKLPKEPVRIIAWIRANGGLKDPGGDIQSIIGVKPNRSGGLINNKSGMDLDAATLRLWEPGGPRYLEGAERPETQALLDAIEDDRGGKPRYAAADADLVEAYRSALDHNAEITRLAHEYNIQTNGLTRAQFFDRVSEAMSHEHQAAEIASQGEAFEAAFAEAEKRAKEALEARGDAWEPDHIYGGGERTLEDLENERKQEATARGPIQGAGGAQEPGPAAGGQGPVQEGGGPRGPSAGAAGSPAEAAAADRAEATRAAGAKALADDAARNRAGERGGATGGERGGEPETPNARFRDRGDQGLIDKAGNIRLDKLNQPEDIDEIIRQTAERRDDFLPERRGIISDGQALELADALGIDPSFLDRKRIGDAFNEEEVIAAKRLLIQSAGSVRDAMVKAAKGGDAELLELAKAITKHEMIQGKVAQATAEWGRAGRAFNMLMEGGGEERELAQFLKDNTGRTLNQLKEMAEYGQRMKTPKEISQFVHDTANGKIKQAVIYYYVNALISGPVTHFRYSVGNAINALIKPLVQIPYAAALGKIAGRADRVYLPEMGEQLYALGKGTRDALSVFGQSWRENRTIPLPGEHVSERFAGPTFNPMVGVFGETIGRPLGTALGYPGRSVGAIHSAFKYLRYPQEIAGLAYRSARIEGLEPGTQEFTDRVAYLNAHPTDEMMANATGHSLKELYMKPLDYHSWQAGLVRLSNQNLVAKIIVPFMRMGSAITKTAYVESTPLGLAFKEVRGTLRSHTAEADLQAAKILTGVSVMGATALMVAEGLGTGDGPTDPAKRAVWLLSHKPNTITIGPISLPYAGLGHVGMLMRFAANMTETAQAWTDTDETGGQLAKMFFENITRSVLDENFMKGLNNAMEAVYHPDEYGMSFIRNFAANWLPFSVGLGQIAREVDPYMRDTRGILEPMWDRIPVVSESLYPRVDIFGQPIPNHGPTQSYETDPVVQRMDALHMGIGALKRDILGWPLTEQQYYDYATKAGRITKQRLDQTVRNPNFANLPAEVQIIAIKQIVEGSRAQAAAVIKADAARGVYGGPETNIIKGAIDKKTAPFRKAVGQ